MRIALRFLGIELLAIETSDDEQADGPGDCTTQPIGFAPSYGDQRWESGVEH